jgi:hypothetical protein
MLQVAACREHHQNVLLREIRLSGVRRTTPVVFNFFVRVPPDIISLQLCNPPPQSCWYIMQVIHIV